MTNTFSGVKAALYYHDKLLVYLRDNVAGLRYANMWDFFGGGREGEETPFETIRRELQEELGFSIKEAQVVFERIFPAMHDPSQEAYFMVIKINNDNFNAIRFGSEGQEYKLMDVWEFMQDENVVPLLKPRLKSYLDSLPKPPCNLATTGV